jgi:hypothetical protein
MSYSTDPVSDADRHIEAQDSFTERLNAEIENVKQDIYISFSKAAAWICTCRFAKVKTQHAQRMRRSGCCLIRN